VPDCASSFDALSTPLRHSDFLVDRDSLVILCQVTWHAITEDIQFVVDGMEVSPCELGSIYPAVPALQLDIISTNNGTPAGINSDGRLTCRKSIVPVFAATTD